MRFLQGYEHVSTNNGASWGICISSGGYVIVVARLPGVFHVYARSNIAPEGLRNITERIHVEGPLVGVLLVACTLDSP